MSELLEIQGATQGQAEEALQRGISLQKKWGDYISTVEAVYSASKGKKMSEVLKAVIANSLENTDQSLKEKGIDAFKRKLETTTVLSPGEFIWYGFDVITALLPSLAIEEVVSIQPMDRPTGLAFFLSFTIPKAKGSMSAGSHYLSAKSGPANTASYSSDLIDTEDIYQGDGTTASFTGASLAWLPIMSGTVVVNATVGNNPVIGTADASGNITGEGIVSGNVNYATGAISVVFEDAPDEDTAVWATYRYDMDRSFPPEIDLGIAQLTLTAERRRLRTNWMMDAAFTLKKAHGKDADTELLNAVIAGINHEISVDVFNDIYAHATASEATFDLTPSSPMIRQVDWNEQILSFFVDQSNAIYDKTRRAYGNVIIAGRDVCNVIESLPETYWRAGGGAIQSGPHKIGTLGGKFTVIKNFSFKTEAYVMGYKSENYLDAGYVWAPYLPVYATNPIALDDTKVRRGIGSMAAKQMLNSDFYAKGTVEFLPAP